MADQTDSMNAKIDETMADLADQILDEAKAIANETTPNTTWGEIGWDDRMPKDTTVRSGVVFEGPVEGADLEPAIIEAFGFDETEETIYREVYKEHFLPVEELINTANKALRREGMRGIVTLETEKPWELVYYVWEKPRPVPVTVQLDDDLSGYVRRFCEHNGLTLSGVVNGAVEEWRNRQERQAQGLNPSASTEVRINFEGLREALEGALVVEDRPDLIGEAWSVDAKVGLHIESDGAAHADVLFTCNHWESGHEIELVLNSYGEWDRN